MKATLLAAITVFIDFVGFGVIIPISTFYAEGFGASPLEITLLFSVYTMAQFIFSPIWGRLSDREGRKKFLILGLTGEFISYLIYAFATSLWLLFLARIISGALTANYPLLQAYVADNVSEVERGKAYGILSAALGSGFVVGPALGGLLSSFGYRFPILINAFLVLFNLILVSVLMKEDKITKRATEIKGNLLVNFSIPYGTLALLYLAFVIFQTTLALYAQRYYDWGAIQVEIALTIIGLESAILQIVVVPRLINKISAKNTIILGGISMGIGFAMIYLKFIIWVSILIIGLGSSMFLTSGSLLISILVGESRKGEGLGLLQSLNSLMGVIGPIVGGSVFQLYDASQPYLLASIVCLIGSLLLMIKYPLNVK